MLVPCRTDTSSVAFVVSKIFYRELLWLVVLTAFALLTSFESTLLLFALLVSTRPCKRWLALAKMTIRDVCIGACRFNCCNHGFAVKSTVSRDLRLGKTSLLSSKSEKFWRVASINGASKCASYPELCASAWTTIWFWSSTTARPL